MLKNTICVIEVICTHHKRTKTLVSLAKALHLFPMVITTQKKIYHIIF